MLSITDRPVTPQPAITAERALVIARQRFPTLAANGILGRRTTGPPIDPEHVAMALAFLARCRKSKFENCHSFDLRRAIGGVSVGAVIAAAHALGFDVRGWIGTREFFPGAIIGVNAADVARRVAELSL
jgi:hypothetical protein